MSVPVAASNAASCSTRQRNVFEPGIRYHEKVVIARLAEIHGDVAALRRHLVDEGFMARERGVTGGWAAQSKSSESGARSPARA